MFWLLKIDNRLKPVEKPVAGRGKSCNAGRLREVEGCRSCRLRYTACPTKDARHGTVFRVKPEHAEESNGTLRMDDAQWS